MEQITIREYTAADETAWVRCRVISFLDCSYWNDVKREKERYPHPGISLVADADGMIVGLIDGELDSEDLTVRDHGRGAVVWHMAVLPEYRRFGVGMALWKEMEKRLIRAGVTHCELWTQEDTAANQFYQRMGLRLQPEHTVGMALWKEMEKRLIRAGVTHCELWTQEDTAANQFYQRMGLRLQPEHTWLRCYADAKHRTLLVDRDRLGSIYGVEELVFGAKPEDRERLRPLCHRIDEVRLYTKELSGET